MTEIISGVEKKPEVYTYQINMFDFSYQEPKIIFDVTMDYKKKLKALECFKSQRIWTVLLKPMILLKGVYFGKKAGFGFAEYFYAE
jgi:LmbE family N-acetylglucosaminyl deacetylase